MMRQAARRDMQPAVSVSCLNAAACIGMNDERVTVTVRVIAQAVPARVLLLLQIRSRGEYLRRPHRGEGGRGSGRDKHHSPVIRIIYSIVVIANGAIWRPSLVAGLGRQWMNAKLQGHIVPSQSLQAESIPSLCFCTESSPSFGMLHGARFSFPSLGRRTNTP